MKKFFLSINILITVFNFYSVCRQEKFTFDSLFLKENHDLGGYIMPIYEHSVDANEFKFKYLRIKSKGKIHSHIGYFIQFDAAKEFTLKDAFIDIRTNNFIIKNKVI